MTDITRRTFLKSLGIATTACVLRNRTVGAVASKKQPNFLFILVDDLGWADLGCYGSTFYESPNVDRIAAEGMKFTNGYAACPVCSPTRASLMTGKHPARLNLTNWISGKIKKKLIGAPFIQQLPLEEFTIAEAFKESGYKTFFAGKWHLGKTEFWPEHQGFDINKGGCHKGGPYSGGKYFTPYDNPRLEDGPRGEHLPDRLATETAKFIEQNKDKPFFAYLSFYSVHEPIMTRDDLLEKYTKKAESFPETLLEQEGDKKNRLTQNHPVYAGMIEAMDEAIGKVFKKLEALRLYDDTIVCFLSDNGGLSTHNNRPTSNVPLRAGKGYTYEGGIRVPFIVKWPGVTKPGAVCDEPVVSTDFYPTLLEMAGMKPRPDRHRDGLSLGPLLKGADSLDRRALYWHYPHYAPQGGRPSSAVRAGDYKLIEFYEDGRIELFNVAEDISEKRNLSKSMPEKAKELHEMLMAWRVKVDAKMPSPNPEYREEKTPAEGSAR
ncbi:sulfatase [Candidatus Hydrogenedentota bacterium]